MDLAAPLRLPARNWRFAALGFRPAAPLGRGEDGRGGGRSTVRGGGKGAERTA